MKIGVVFPQTELPPDPIVARDYAQTVEGLGFTHLYVYDHVLGANPERPGGWKGNYTYQDSFLEPFVLFSYLSGLTQKLEFVTGILILPQRQTALVAKQAASLDVLCQGRLRLGVGLGWNEVEYISLGENFHNRGRRLEEQVNLLRLLWTQPLVQFEGRWHNIPDAGLNPLPIQRPIPIWFGGTDDRALHRAVLLGDGWLSNARTIEAALPQVDKINQYLEETGRDKDTFGIEPRLNFYLIKPEEREDFVQSWEKLGATHLSINTMGSEYATPSAHLEALQHFAKMFGLI